MGQDPEVRALVIDSYARSISTIWKVMTPVVGVGFLLSELMWWTQGETTDYLCVQHLGSGSTRLCETLWSKPMSMPRREWMMREWRRESRKVDDRWRVRRWHLSRHRACDNVWLVCVMPHHAQLAQLVAGPTSSQPKSCPSCRALVLVAEPDVPTATCPNCREPVPLRLSQRRLPSVAQRFPLSATRDPPPPTDISKSFPPPLHRPQQLPLHSPPPESHPVIPLFPTPDPLSDVTRIRLRTRATHCLYPGAIFQGTQKSGRNSYDVTVTVVVRWSCPIRSQLTYSTYIGCRLGHLLFVRLSMYSWAHRWLARADNLFRRRDHWQPIWLSNPKLGR